METYRTPIGRFRWEARFVNIAGPAQMNHRYERFCRVSSQEVTNWVQGEVRRQSTTVRNRLDGGARFRLVSVNFRSEQDSTTSSELTAQFTRSNQTTTEATQSESRDYHLEIPAGERRSIYQLVASGSGFETRLDTFASPDEHGNLPAIHDIIIDIAYQLVLPNIRCGITIREGEWQTNGEHTIQNFRYDVPFSVPAFKHSERQDYTIEIRKTPDGTHRLLRLHDNPSVTWNIDPLPMISAHTFACDIPHPVQQAALNEALRTLPHLVKLPLPEVIEKLKAELKAKTPIDRVIIRVNFSEA